MGTCFKFFMTSTLNDSFFGLDLMFGITIFFSYFRRMFDIFVFGVVILQTIFEFSICRPQIILQQN